MASIEVLKIKMENYRTISLAFFAVIFAFVIFRLNSDMEIASIIASYYLSFIPLLIAIYYLTKWIKSYRLLIKKLNKRK